VNNSIAMLGTYGRLWITVRQVRSIRASARRFCDPWDGRQINIKLTARGITLRRNAKEATHGWLSRTVAELDRQEQITLFKAGELFKRMAEMS
jgi:hypothetical protein